MGWAGDETREEVTYLQENLYSVAASRGNDEMNYITTATVTDHSN